MVQRVVEFLVRQLTFLSRHALPPSFDTDYHIPSCALLQLALKNNTNAIVLSADCFDYSVHRLGSELNWHTLVRARGIVSSPFKQRRSIFDRLWLFCAISCCCCECKRQTTILSKRAARQCSAPHQSTTFHTQNGHMEELGSGNWRGMYVSFAWIAAK